jgi:CRISPR/Cas system-associated protein Cas7 (RAMP superfamily)
MVDLVNFSFSFLMHDTVNFQTFIKRGAKWELPDCKKNTKRIKSAVLTLALLAFKPGKNRISARFRMLLPTGLICPPANTLPLYF